MSYNDTRKYCIENDLLYMCIWPTIDEGTLQRRIDTLYKERKREAKDRHAEVYDLPQYVCDPWMRWWKEIRRHQDLSRNELLREFEEAKLKKKAVGRRELQYEYAVGLHFWGLGRMHELAIFELFRDHLDFRRYHALSTSSTIPTWIHILSKQSQYYRPKVIRNWFRFWQPPRMMVPPDCLKNGPIISWSS
ncbi:hypothetical protein BDZ89DRAFT_374916 [Hymenopellis radicata]|nr:hypothetical protein BDZ89DRAFT_374916 [Hymenopellis radicata]